MRLLICAGGTGGGVYPALSVLQTLSSNDTSVLWVGGEGGMEKDLVEREKVPYTSIPAAGLHGVGLSRLPANLMKLAQGVRASQKILQEFKPDALFFTGGYLAAPMAFAGRHLPSLVFVPDIEPGLSLKFLFRFARIIAVSVEDGLTFLPKTTRAEVTGYPIRADFSRWNQKTAQLALSLEESSPVIGVFGGSKGARSINRAVLANLPELLNQAQVLHVTGKLDWDEVNTARAQLSTTLADRYHVFPYLHEEMGAALAASDIIVSRAGASTLGEYPFYGVPALLVPYPYAWRYQKVNAAYLTGKGAALTLIDEDLATSLAPTLKTLLSDRERLRKMSSAMKSLAHPGAANRLSQLLLDLGAGSSQKRSATW